VSAAIEWEKWLGVRGAAAVGAGVLVLAGLYFFKYSIDTGLLTTTLRVVLGTLVGLACVVAAEVPLRKRYPVLANWLAGAGAAILYIAFWAGTAHYGIIPNTVGFGLMGGVTVMACIASVRHRAMPIAILGLLGGFATPILLSTGSDRPIALFSYLLLLDGALLWVAHHRRWPALGLLSLGATTLYQALWILDDMGPERLFMGLGILAVFAALFAAVPGRDGERSSTDRLTRALAVLSPFGFALFFAADADLGPWFYPIGLLLLVLSTGALFVARRDAGHSELPVLGLIAAAGSVGVLAVFLLRARPDTLLGALDVIGFAGALALLFHCALEVRPERPAELRLAALVACVGPMALTALVATVTPAVPVWMWALGWALSTALVYRSACFEGGTPLAALAPVGFASALAVVTALRAPALTLLSRGDVTSATTNAELLLLSLCVLTLVSFVSLWLPDRLRRHATVGVAVATLVLLAALGLSLDTMTIPVAALVGGALVYQLLGTLAAARLGHGAWLLAVSVLSAIVLTYAASADPRLDESGGALLLGGVLVATLLATFAPHLTTRSLSDPWAHRAAALGGPLFFFAMKRAFDVAFGDGFIGSLPIALATIALLSLLALRRRVPDGDARRVGVVWLAAVIAGFVTLAVPLQLDREWITVAWALEGVALLFLWVRLDHPGLKYFAIALLATVTVRLTANPFLLEYHLRSELPGFVWLSYTFLVPVACLAFAHVLTWRHEARLMRAWEGGAAMAEWRIASRALAVAAIAVGFVYINLVIFDRFAVGEHLRIPTDHAMARDLVLSLAWALYGLGLLGLGMGRKATGLRAIGLGLVALTAAKVFLYDLSHLADLYRVASLVGLATSLLLISLAYQRFVFQKVEVSR
jgi:uncharacterized membrane protein